MPTQPNELWGTVPVEGRGSLPFQLLRNEPLLVWASGALEAAEVLLVDFDVPWADVVAAAALLVVHDPLCPLTPPEFITRVVARAQETGHVAVGVHESDGGWSVVSPLVLPAGVVARLTDWPDTADLAALARSLHQHAVVEHVLAPPAAARVHEEADVRALAAFLEAPA